MHLASGQSLEFIIVVSVSEAHLISIFKVEMVAELFSYDIDADARKLAK